MSRLSTPRMRVRSAGGRPATYCRLPCRPSSSPPNRMTRRSCRQRPAGEHPRQLEHPGRAAAVVVGARCGRRRPAGEVDRVQVRGHQDDAAGAVPRPGRSAITLALDPEPTVIDGRLPRSRRRSAARAQSAASPEAGADECRVGRPARNRSDSSKDSGDSAASSSAVPRRPPAPRCAGGRRRRSPAAAGSTRQSDVASSPRPLPSPATGLRSRSGRSTTRCRPWSRSTGTSGCCCWNDRPTWVTRPGRPGPFAGPGVATRRPGRRAGPPALDRCLGRRHRPGPPPDLEPVGGQLHDLQHLLAAPLRRHRHGVRPRPSAIGRGPARGRRPDPRPIR